MENMNRRSLLKILSAAPVAASFALTDVEAQEAHHLAQTTTARPRGRPEWPSRQSSSRRPSIRRCGSCPNLIVPRTNDQAARSTRVCPEFMDFTMVDQPARQLAMRGGLAWLDVECQRRFDKTFVGASEAERHAVLGDLATFGALKPGLTHGQAFFRSFRDLTATGFWTTKIGFADLGYMGNTVVPKWDGCPPEQLEKLGIV